MHPLVASFLRNIGLGAQQVGHKVAAASTAVVLDTVATVGENALKKVRKSQAAAQRMAETGEAYQSPFRGGRDVEDPEDETR